MRDQAALKHRVKPSYCAAAAALRKALAPVASGFETQMAGQRTEVSRVRQFQAKTARPVQLNQQLRGRFPTLVGACAGTGAGAHITGEVAWNGLRLVVAHDRATALAQQQERRVRMDELENLAKDWAGKLDGQDQGARKRGRKLSDSGAKARFYHAVCEARWGKILKLDMKTELFSYAIDEQALRLAEMMDGKLLVLTNVLDMTPDQVIERYKSLADIERGFKVLKSELEIGPVYHRLPERIRAHASICFMALILHRVMRLRSKAANTTITPERALRSLRRIQHHRVSINGAAPLSGVSSITPEQNQVLSALKVKTPSHSQQLSLL